MDIHFKLGCRVDHTRKFGLQHVFRIVAVDSVELLVEFVSAARNFFVKCDVSDVTYTD
jgi:hypothetical protein